MITLITGLPGNGKTLFALWFIKKKAEKENREVFYHNIKDLNLPWTEADPEKWFDRPAGSIVVIDEGQFVFSKKPNGSKLPDYYEKLAVHRHMGLDIFVITQHPSLLDNFVRKLVGQHFHVVRKFGLNRATIYEWSSANEQPQNRAQQDASISMKWGYPKEVYGYYKSAEVHTVKRAIPVKLVLFVLFALGVAGYAIYTFTSFGRKSEDVKPAEVAQEVVAAAKAVSPVAGQSGQASTASPGYAAPEEDAKQYLWSRTPRLEGMPETAPRYDALTAPTRVPVPAMCIQKGDVRSGNPIRCQCYTQQATKLDVEFNMCIDIARNGRFMDFDPEPNRRRDNSAVQLADASHVDRSAQVLSARVPDVAMGPNYSASSVSSFTDVPSGIEGARPPPNLNDGPPPGRTTRTEVVQQ